jgi:hypothetical protein
MLDRLRCWTVLAALAYGCGDDDTSADAGLDGDGSAEAESGADADADADAGADADADAEADADAGRRTFAELCASPGVLFCDGFEGAFDPAWHEDGGDVRIVGGAAVAGEGSTVLELATYEGRQSSKLFYQFADLDEVYVRFDVQYAEDYDNSGGSHGPILGGSSDPPWGMFGTAGIKPNGDDFFVLNFEPNGTVGEGGEFGFYAYFVNMAVSGDGRYWGNDFLSPLDPGPVIVRGRWHCAEYGLRLNTPGDTTDGHADFWVDGVHHGSFDGFTWRTVSTFGANTFSLDSYNHFNDGPRPADSPNLVRYDNFVLSTRPVGCLEPAP